MGVAGRRGGLRLCVYFTGDLINAVPALRPAEVATAAAVEDGDVSPSKRKGKMHGIEVGRRESSSGSRRDGPMVIYSDHSRRGVTAKGNEKEGNPTQNPRRIQVEDL